MSGLKHSITRYWLVGCLLTLCGMVGTQASAQTQPVEYVPLNTPVTAVFTHPGVGTTGYRVYVDNVQVGPDVPVSALVNGEIRMPVPGIATGGAHTLEAAAFNANGERRSTPLSLFVGLPVQPSGLRIEIVTKTTAVVEPQSDGTMKLRIESVDTTATVK